MIISLFGIYHEISKVTAIALCDNGKEECRQDALLVAREDHGEIITDVVFGWDMPKDVEEFMEMGGDPYAWEELEDAHKVR